MSALERLRQKSKIKQKVSTTLKDKVNQLQQKASEADFTVTPELEAIEDFDANNFMTTLQDLELAVSSKAPDMGTLMMKIHKNLKQYPELCHILSDDQIKIAVSGFLVQAGIETAPRRKSDGGIRAIVEGKSSQEINDLLDLGL